MAVSSLGAVVSIFYHHIFHIEILLYDRFFGATAEKRTEKYSKIRKKFDEKSITLKKG